MAGPEEPQHLGKQETERDIPQSEIASRKAQLTRPLRIISPRRLLEFYKRGVDNRIPKIFYRRRPKVDQLQQDDILLESQKHGEMPQTSLEITESTARGSSAESVYQTLTTNKEKEDYFLHAAVAERKPLDSLHGAELIDFEEGS